MTRSNSLLPTLAGATILTALAPLAAQGGAFPCWEPNLGTDLMLSDDAISSPQALGFSFPLPGGVGTTTDIIVSSNGFVYLDAVGTGNGCCSGRPADLVNNPSPRIAPWWHDLNPSGGGAVYFNVVGGRAVVTWDQVPEYPTNGVNTVQLQMDASGAFQITYQSITDPGTHTALVGVSIGGGTADPGEVDLTVTPNSAPSVPTVYEEFVSGTDTRDLGGKSLLFLPDGQGGYVQLLNPMCAQASVDRYGTGCPGGTTFYEQFTGAGTNDLQGMAFELAPNMGGGYSVTPSAATYLTPVNNLGLGDDSLASGNMLGFSFSWPGAGSISTIDIDSNGRCGPLLTGSDFTESVNEFLMQPLLAVLWDDLNPANGGGVYFDTSPGMAVVTWDAVPQYPSNGANSVQAQFFSDGRIILVYQACLDDSICGFADGSLIDPGSSDLTARVPFGTATGTPLDLDATPPQLGSTVTFTASNLPPSAAAGIVLLGLTQLNLPLDSVGAPSCVLLTDSLGSLPLGPSNTAQAMVPNTTSLNGATLNAQSIVFAGGANQLGVVLSNGLVLTLGQ